MSRFPTSDSIIGKALQVVPTADNAIDARSAWLFENQTGTLGTNLNGSVLYVSEVTGAAAAVKADVAVILAGVNGVIGTVTALDPTDPYGSNPSYNALSNGSGYVTANAVATTVTSTVPKSPAKQPTGLTVNITVAVPAVVTTPTTGGTGYSAGVISNVTSGGAGTGIEGTVTVVGGAVTTFTFTDGGSGYVVGDVITLIQAGSDDNATITLTEVTNGAITTIAINAAGSNYSPGDIITVAQGGSGSNATRAILAVLDLPPVIGDAVVFKNVPMGTILPVSVDYFMATGSTANIVCIAGK